MATKTGRIIWLTGISGAGKTTLALLLEEELKRQFSEVELLDGRYSRRKTKA